MSVYLCMHTELPTNNGTASEIRLTTSVKEGRAKKNKKINHQARKEKKGEQKKRIRSNGPPTVSYGDGQDQAGTTRATSRGSRNSRQEGIIVVCAKNAGKDLSRKTHAKGQLAEARRGEGGGETWRMMLAWAAVR